MVHKMLKTISTKILLWLLIPAALYFVSCLLGIERSTRVLVKTSDMGSTVFVVWCQFACLVLTTMFLFFHWQLGKVDADKPALLKSCVSTLAFMIVTVPLITEASLCVGFSLILGKTVQWIQPVLMKWILTYFTLHLMFRQIRELTGSWFRALKVVLFLTVVWSTIILVMALFYLHLGLYKTFTQTSTHVVDVTTSSYGHLLLASYILFIVVNNYKRNRHAVTTPVQAVQLHPTARVALIYNLVDVITTSCRHILLGSFSLFFVVDYKLNHLAVTIPVETMQLHPFAIFTQTSTHVGVTTTSYGYLLGASCLIFLVVNYKRYRQTVMMTPVQTVQKD